jgi:hypothetical protein
LALIGVVGSMIFQVRATQATQEQSSREHHAHLVEMSMNDPVYQLAWGETSLSTLSPDSWRQRVYVNLIMSYWERDYLQRNMPKNMLIGSLTLFFRGEAGRSWWGEIRELRFANAKNRRDRRFLRIVDEEYKKALRAGPPIIPARPPSNPETPSEQHGAGVRMGVTITLAAIGGAILGRALNRMLASK